MTLCCIVSAVKAFKEPLKQLSKDNKMASSVNLFNSDYCNDALSHTLSFLEIATNIETTPWVCKNWNLVAKQVVKMPNIF